MLVSWVEITNRGLVRFMHTRKEDGSTYISTHSKTVFMRFELKVALTQRLALKAKNGCLLW